MSIVSYYIKWVTTSWTYSTANGKGEGTGAGQEA